MRLNYETCIIGTKVVLVPYRPEHVPRYHQWMLDPHLLEMTGSEPLSMAEEVEMQQSWRDDPHKCTFIVLDKEKCLFKQTIGEKEETSEDEVFCQRNLEAMVGDVNLFFSEEEEEETDEEEQDVHAGHHKKSLHEENNTQVQLQAELDIMIAEESARGRGFGKEASCLMMLYGAKVKQIRRYFCKIKAHNTASLKLFEQRLQFQQCAFAECFQEYELERKFDTFQEMENAIQELLVADGNGKFEWNTMHCPVTNEDIPYIATTMEEDTMTNSSRWEASVVQPRKDLLEENEAVEDPGGMTNMTKKSIEGISHKCHPMMTASPLLLEEAEENALEEALEEGGAGDDLPDMALSMEFSTTTTASPVSALTMPASIATTTIIAQNRSRASSSSNHTQTIAPRDSLRWSNYSNSSSFTINKLDFQHLELQGRDQELQCLQSVLASRKTRLLAQKTQQSTSNSSSNSRSPSQPKQPQQQRRQLVWVSGPSGSGKSALVQQCLHDVYGTHESHHGLYVTGKCDFHLRHQPYSGIVMACGAIGSHVLRLSHDKQQAFQSRIQLALSQDDLHILLQMIPVLAEFLDDLSPTTTATIARSKTKTIAAEGTTTATSKATNNTTASSSTSTATTMKNRFHFAFCAWMRVVAEQFAPFTLVLDDLQWADQSSLTLLEHLMISSNNNRNANNNDTMPNNDLLVIGIHRLVETDNNDLEIKMSSNNEHEKVTNHQNHNNSNIVHPLIQTKQNLARFSAETTTTTTTTKAGEKGAGASLEIVEIVLDNLTLASVHSVVQTLLSLDNDPGRTLGLAQLCLKKTAGNPLFLLQYMAMLHHQQLVHYNFGIMRWVWDLSQIAETTQSAENVVDLLQQKMMTQLTPQQRDIVALAACFGATFSQRHLTLVWNQLVSGGILLSQNDDAHSHKHDHHHDETAERSKTVTTATTKPTSKTTTETTTTPEVTQLHEISDALNGFENVGFIERITNNQKTTIGNHTKAIDFHKRHKDDNDDVKFRWVHDRIQEAAVCLMPQEQRPVIQRHVGEALLANLKNNNFDNNETESIVFVIAELLDQGTSPSDVDQLYDQAQLYLRATQHAISISAFDSAANYASRGIQRLVQLGHAAMHDKWSDQNYQLCLQLYTLGARAEGYLGNIEPMQLYCNEVLSQENRPLQDKLPVYNTLVDSFGDRGNPQQAVEMILGVLKRYDCQFPSQGSVPMINILWNVTKIKFSLNQNWFNGLKEMDDPIRVDLMRFLDQLMTYLYILDVDLMALVVFRMLYWTRKYGYCEFSTVAIGFTGVILQSALNDLESGRVCRELAELLMKKKTYQSTEARSLLIIHGFLKHWQQPIRDSIKPLLQGYERGLQTGDSESAGWCIYHYCWMRFFTSVSLETLEMDLRAYCSQLKSLQRINQIDFLRMLFLLVLNLRDRAKYGLNLVLDGEAINAAEYAARAKDNKYLSSALNNATAAIYCYFGDHEKLAKLTVEYGYSSIAEAFPGTVLVVMDVFTKGISCFAAARSYPVTWKRQRKQFASMGKKCLAMLSLWSKKGNVNVKHHLALLDAEHAAYRGKRAKAVELYKTALRLAARSGFVQDAALASERLGIYFMERPCDEDEGIFQIREAVKYYQAWGAIAKVSQLEETYPFVSTKPNEVPVPNTFNK